MNAVQERELALFGPRPPHPARTWLAAALAVVGARLSLTRVTRR